MFAQLGEVIFRGLESPKSWETEAEWNWVDVPRIGVKATSQPIAPELKTHSIAIEISSSFADPGASVARLVAMGDAMESVAYFLGNSEFVSFVTLRKMEISRRHMGPTGNLESVEITLELSEHARKGKTQWD